MRVSRSAERKSGDLRALIYTSDMTINFGLRSLILASIGVVNVSSVSKITGSNALRVICDSDVLIVAPGAISIPDFAAIRQIRSRCKSVKIIVFSEKIPVSDRLELFEYGADAIVDSRAEIADVKSAFRSSLNGEARIDRSLPDRPDVVRCDHIREVVMQMTPRVHGVMKLVYAGYRTREISEILGLEYDTARAYVSLIIRRLNARNRVHAITSLMDAGISTDFAPSAGEGDVW